jgi:glycine/D-amino acid oxidase-like deaminating enzyme
MPSRTAPRSAEQRCNSSRRCAIKLKGKQVTAVVTNHGEISTRVVINCAGPWAGKVGDMAGIRYSLRFSREFDVKFQIAASHGTFPLTPDPEHGSYFRPQTGGFAIAGLAFSKELEPCDPDECDDKATPAQVDRISNKLTTRMPRIGDGLPVAGWARVYSITADWHPIVRDAPGLQGYYHFIGGSGHGFKISPPIGEALAAQIAGSPPGMDISRLHYSRFENGNIFHAAWGGGNRA